jgi:lipoate-protein ligase A
VLEVDRPSVVLGSSQSVADIDPVVAARTGVDVARRRSGGGAVLLAPGSAVWVDIVVPVGDAWWEEDVGKAAWPVGRAWAAALEAIGSGPGSVWQGPLQRSEWSERVCFAGLGAGEVQVRGRKVVGISQRRTRQGALFQTVGLLEWDAAAILALLGVAGPEQDRAMASLADAAAGVGPGRGDAVRDALLDALMT